ncbi:MAG: sigma-70 family RNA polymerase sigma factor [Clostridiales bacterium]|nr:sigma-70 family RNA polymerase sigma factor [Clostridiales bacterium]
MQEQKYQINVNGNLVEVSEEVYRSYYRSKRRDRYYERDIKTETAVRDENGTVSGVRPAKEDSLDRLLIAGADYADESVNVEADAIRTVMAGALHEALELLTEAERELVDALFFSNSGAGMTEREYAALSGIPQKTINDRKTRIIIKLRKLLES